jgi:hypothetical protein
VALGVLPATAKLVLTLLVIVCETLGVLSL